jgi:hypothetical protein
VTGQRLNGGDEQLLAAWIAKNEPTLVASWDSDIEYAEDMVARIQPL